MPRWKWIGNRALTWVENAAFRRGYSEYHTGYRAFSADFLRSVPFARNSDGFVFDQQIFAQVIGPAIDSTSASSRSTRRPSSRGSSLTRSLARPPLAATPP